MTLGGVLLSGLFFGSLLNFLVRPAIHVWLTRRALRHDPVSWLRRQGRPAVDPSSIQTMWVHGTVGRQDFIHLPVVVAVLTPGELFVESEVPTWIRRGRLVVPSGTTLRYDRNGVVQLPRQDHAITSNYAPDLIEWLRSNGWTLTERSLLVPESQSVFRRGAGERAGPR